MLEEFVAYEFVGSSKLRMPYRLLTPSDLRAGENYPLVLFFHGSGERGNDNLKQLANGARRFTRADSRSRFPCFVLAPQCPTHYGNQPTMWTGTREEMHKLKLAPEPAVPLQTALELSKLIQEKYPIDSNRVYLSGISMGGFATWEALIRDPQRYAGATPVCGGGDQSRAGQIKHIPVWAFHGADDPVVPVQCSRMMIEGMQKAGGDPRYTEYPGVGHNSWDRAFSEPEMLSWLFSHQRG